MSSTPGDSAEEWLQGWFRKQAPDIYLELEQNYFELGAIDSFRAIELIEDIETHFSIRFTEQDFQDRRFGTIKGLAKIIGEKR